MSEKDTKETKALSRQEVMQKAMADALPGTIRPTDGFVMEEVGADNLWVTLAETKKKKWPQGYDGKPPVIQGFLVGVDQLKNKDGKVDPETGEVRVNRFFNLIATTDRIPVTDSSDKARFAKMGEMVSLSKRDRLEKLEEIAERPGMWEVQIEPTIEKDIGGGQSLWLFNIASRQVVDGNGKPV